MNKKLGIWMWADLPIARGAAQAVDDCAFAGITDIFLLTKGLRGTSATAPIGGVLGVAAPGRDILQETLDAAHARGIRLHAWLTSASDALYKAAHPESGLCHFTRGRDRDIISITDEPYIQYMERFVSALTRRYPVDGLHLDYIRYNHLVYGWSEADLARYAAAGADVPRLQALMRRTFFDDPPEAECIFDAWRAGDPSVLALSRTRRENVVAFARRMTAAARAGRPSLCLSAALMPEGAYDDLAFSDLHYGQNYQDASALYDLALPMAYSQAYEKDAAWVADVTRGTAARGLRTLTGLHAYEGGTGETLAADQRAVEALGSLAGGTALFRAGTVACARLDGVTLTVRNALEAPLTRLTANYGGADEPLSLAAPLAIGEEISLPLPARPRFLRAFSGDTETSIFLFGE